MAVYHGYIAVVCLIGQYQLALCDAKLCAETCPAHCNVLRGVAAIWCDVETIIIAQTLSTHSRKGSYAVAYVIFKDFHLKLYYLCLILAALAVKR